MNNKLTGGELFVIGIVVVLVLICLFGAIQHQIKLSSRTVDLIVFYEDKHVDIYHDYYSIYENTKEKRIILKDRQGNSKVITGYLRCEYDIKYKK